MPHLIEDALSAAEGDWTPADAGALVSFIDALAPFAAAVQARLTEVVQWADEHGGVPEATRSYLADVAGGAGHMAIAAQETQESFGSMRAFLTDGR